MCDLCTFSTIIKSVLERKKNGDKILGNEVSEVSEADQGCTNGNLYIRTCYT